MRQAKQQSQDLRQTDSFLTTIMKPSHPEKEKVKHSENHHPRQMNGRPKMPRVDSFSRFSDPPAPPPQQPLPEKPDALPRNGTDALASLKRSDTEKPKVGAGNSPVSRESSQILSLIEALSSAKRELESQGARVKELESLLVHERTARESAEGKAINMETHPATNGQEPDGPATLEPPLGSAPEDTIEQSMLEKQLDLEESDGTDDSIVASGADKSQDVQTQQLQCRLEEAMVEMEEIRQQVATWKHRAQKAEDESTETRKSLAEMIETLRRERAQKGEVAGAKSESQSQEPVKSGKTDSATTEHTKASKAKDSEVSVYSVPSSQVKGDAGTAFATQQQKQSPLEQSSPYTSMLGVVLLGVGVMAYLNGWQRMDK